MEEEAEDSLDLSYLTDTEQAAILEVLLRDTQLRRCDEGRVRTLQQTERDPARLLTLSGSWFKEERSKRHRDQKPGCDLVHATLRRRKTKDKDGPLSGLFAGQTEEATPAAAHASHSPAIGQRLRVEEETGGGRERITLTPTPRSKSPLIQRVPDPNSTYSSSECMSTSNGHHEEAKDYFEGHDGDNDSASSGVTELYSTTLKNSGSASSLHGSYALSGSMMSLFSTGEFGTVEVKGRLQLSLVFDKHMEELQVKVCRCEDLAPAHKNRTDPYVKTYLLPDKSSQSKKKTSVKKKTLNPVYDQTLRYKVPMGDLLGRTLNLSVWHAQPLGRNIFLGEVELPLGLWDWSSIQPTWHDLQPRIQLSPDSISSRGTISLSIKFIPEGSEGSGLPLTGELHIWLRQAQGLLSHKGGAVDSFVKSYILPDASRQSGQKTKVAKHTFSPAYNHTMVYDGFHNEDLREACAELTVWQREGLKTYLLGGTRLSFGTGQSYKEAVNWMDSTEEEISVWATMMETPNQWIDATLPIRTNLAHRAV